MDNHLAATAILLFLSIIFRSSNSLRAVFHVVNEFTSRNTIELRVTRGDNGETAAANELVPWKASLKWTVVAADGHDGDEAIIVYSCHVTEGNTYYGFFKVSTSHLIHNALTVSVNEEGAFAVSAKSGYQLLHTWQKLEFYVYNMFDADAKITVISGRSTVVKTEDVIPTEYLHWTKMVPEGASVRHFAYKCRVYVLGSSSSHGKMVELFDSSLIDFELLEELKTMSYVYAVGEYGIGYFDPKTAGYTHLHNWP